MPSLHPDPGFEYPTSPAKKAIRAVEKMRPLFTEKCPFVNPPNIKEKIQWVRPKLACEVEYAELTDALSNSGHLSTSSSDLAMPPRSWSFGMRLHKKFALDPRLLRQEKKVVRSG